MGRAGTAADRSAAWAVAIGAGALAFCVRWNLAGRLSGLHAYYGYDDGVYFASAVSFVHGLMPYDDYLLLHPPGITLALAPFALLTRWIRDSDALAVARIAFMLVGAANTVLVSRIALRWGLRSATVAGSLYAVSYAAANTEYLTLLEPLGTLFLLGGVVLLLRSADPSASAWWTYVGGAVIGLGLVIKIWDIVPVLIVLGWLTVESGRVAAVRAGAATVVSASAALLPFGVEAGHRMLRLVVLDQLGRPRGSADLATRLGGVSGVDLDASRLPGTVRPLLLAFTLGVVVLAAAVAWTSRRGRLWVVMLGAQLLVLAASPELLPALRRLLHPGSRPRRRRGRVHPHSAEIPGSGRRRSGRPGPGHDSDGDSPRPSLSRRPRLGTSTRARVHQNGLPGRARPARPHVQRTHARLQHSHRLLRTDLRRRRQECARAPHPPCAKRAVAA